MSIKIDKKKFRRTIGWVDFVTSPYFDFVGAYPCAVNRPYAGIYEMSYDGEKIEMKVLGTGYFPSIMSTNMSVTIGTGTALLRSMTRVWCPTNPTNIFAFFYEPMKGDYANYQGLGDGYVARSKSAGVETTTTLTGQDWSVEREFRLEHRYDRTSMRFLIDGVEVALHTTNISAQPYQIVACETAGVVATAYARYPYGIRGY